MLAVLSGLPRRSLIALVRMYRLLLSPWLGSGCRFEPTCSAYALVALESHGAMSGSVLTMGRLLRCHPWCAGGHDPVPRELKLFRHLIDRRESARRDGAIASNSSSKNSP